MSRENSLLWLAAGNIVVMLSVSTSVRNLCLISCNGRDEKRHKVVPHKNKGSVSFLGSPSTAGVTGGTASTLLKDVN